MGKKTKWRPNFPRNLPKYIKFGIFLNIVCFDEILQKTAQKIQFFQYWKKAKKAK
jgi:hypothetical protein